VFLFSVLVNFEDPDQEFAFRALGDLPVAAFLVAAVASGALYWRRRRPMVVLGVTLAASVLSLLLEYPDSVGFAMVFALYGVGRYATSDRWSYSGVAAVLALAAVSTVLDDEPVGTVGVGLVFVFGIWYIGRRIRVRGDYLRLLEERATQREREQEAAARRAVAEERTRIARELHD
jgi:signal transduction histidine kinase